MKEIKICKFNGCVKKVRTNGFCGTHNEQMRKHGITQEIKPKRDKFCTVKGCNRPHKGFGYCERHYQQIRKHDKTKGHL